MRTLLIILILTSLFIYLLVWGLQTARTNHRRNLELSNLIAEKFFSEYDQGNSHWITTVINLNATTIYTKDNVEAALRYLLTLHRVRIEVNQYQQPIWIAVDLTPAQ